MSRRSRSGRGNSERRGRVTRPPGGAGSASEVASASSTRVEDVLRALAAALRGHRLYEPGNPMRQRFGDAFRQKLAALWDDLPELRLEIEEDRIVWDGERVFLSGESGSDLPFLFYKDGVRTVTFLPGFEEGEVEVLLRLLARAARVREEEDDLITLLWQEDLTYLRYEAVEALTEAGPATGGGGAPTESVDPAAVRAEAHEPAGISPADFQDTLYFLEAAELRHLREEMRREGERDLWRDVLSALLDQLEDGDEERQVRIIRIAAELLPSTLAIARFDRAALLLRELVEVAGRPGVLAPAAARGFRELFDALGSEATIEQLAEILEESPGRLSEPAVQRLFEYLPPAAMGPLIRAAERVERPEVRRSFEACVQRLAESNRDEVVRLLDSGEASVLIGALRWVGRLGLGSAASEVASFLGHPDGSVRSAALGTLVALRAGAAGKRIVPLLGDGDREVRIAAARALGDLGFAPGREALERELGSRRLREADRSEKLAFFEAYGRLAGAAGVAPLERILGARGGWLGRGEPAELRACAALGLARIRHPSAREALERATRDGDPVVRAAVTRALRGEE